MVFYRLCNDLAFFSLYDGVMSGAGVYPHSAAPHSPAVSISGAVIILRPAVSVRPFNRCQEFFFLPPYLGCSFFLNTVHELSSVVSMTTSEGK